MIHFEDPQGSGEVGQLSVDLNLSLKMECSSSRIQEEQPHHILLTSKAKGPIDPPKENYLMIRGSTKK
jgi:hypothetical protein